MGEGMGEELGEELGEATRNFRRGLSEDIARPAERSPLTLRRKKRFPRGKALYDRKSENAAQNAEPRAAGRAFIFTAGRKNSGKHAKLVEGFGL